MEAHPYEAMEAFAEGVKIKWLSTVKQLDQDEVLMERMEMAPDGKRAVGTGQFETLKADSLVLAVGQHSDVEFLKAVPGIRIARGDVIEVDASMSTGHPGIFAGGDLIGLAVFAIVLFGSMSAVSCDTQPSFTIAAQRTACANMPIATGHPTATT